jgi:peptidyl-prolyl cis-trans isomerase C
MRTLPLIALAGVLAGCGQSSHSSATKTVAPAAGTVLVTVNGTPITTGEVNAFVQSRTHGRKIKLNPEQRYMVAQQMVQLTLAAQAARKEGLASKPDVKSKLALQGNMILANQAIKHFMDTATIPESKIRQKYEAFAKSQSGKEYKARHILTKTKAEAEKIIKQLNKDKGANFAALAKKYSTGPSGKQGGELGWFKPQQMVPAFSSALEKLKPGKYTKTPVKSQFGWHIILLEKERTATPPSYTSMKPQLADQIKGSMVRNYLEKLKSKATVHWNISNPAAVAKPPAPTTAKSTSKGVSKPPKTSAPNATTHK